MPGSGANPVRFQNPYHRIVEVGWGKKYIAYRTLIFGSYDRSQDISCVSGIPFGGGAFAYSAFSLSAVHYQQNTAFDVFHLRHGTDWTTISGATVTGLPSSSTPTFAPWIYATTFSIGGVGGAASPKARWDAVTPSGSITPPGFPTAFAAQTSATVSVRVHVFAGTGPACYELAFGTYYKADTTDAPAGVLSDSLTGSTRTADFTIDFGGSVLTYGGRDYEPVGIQITQQPADDAVMAFYPSTPTGAQIGELVVLYRKIPVPPAP